jgi:hypothetical protein
MLGAWGGKLIFVRLPDGRGLLGVQIRATDARFKKPLSRSLLRRGKNPGGRGTLRFQPLFIGVPQVVEKKRFDVEAAVADIADKIPDLFVANFGD